MPYFKYFFLVYITLHSQSIGRIQIRIRPKRFGSTTLSHTHVYFSPSHVYHSYTQEKLPAQVNRKGTTGTPPINSNKSAFFPDTAHTPPIHLYFTKSNQQVKTLQYYRLIFRLFKRTVAWDFWSWVFFHQTTPPDPFRGYREPF